MDGRDGLVEGGFVADAAVPVFVVPEGFFPIANAEIGAPGPGDLGGGRPCT
jgi:hypothetical protein